MAAISTAGIDEAGTELAFIDSGPLPNDSYTTLVLVHGFLYHAQIFSKFFPAAQTYNLRIIALNRRDYVGSTPYSPAELNALTAGDDERSAFLQARGLEIARFLVYVVKELKIPPVSADRKEGGLAVLGWSLGNVTTLAFLGHLKTYPNETLTTSPLDIPIQRADMFFFKDPTVPPEQMGQHFAIWVSSYYKHPYYSHKKQEHERSVLALRLRTPEADEKYRPCSQETFTPEELAKTFDPAAMSRSDGPIAGLIKGSTFHEQAKRALILGHDSNTNDQAVLPQVKVSFLYCSASIWSTTWCAWKLEEDVKKWKAEGHSPRQIRFRLIEGANHFLHWDDPELFLQVVAEELNA